MIWNPWKHVRLAGAVVTIIGVLTHQTYVAVLGLVIQYVGVVAGIDLTERRVAVLEEAAKDENNL
jgi:galactitol-specific phosphotransferase system IIC component